MKLLRKLGNFVLKDLPPYYGATSFHLNETLSSPTGCTLQANVNCRKSTVLVFVYALDFLS